MDVPLQHVLGTIALIVLVAAAGISYQVFVSYVEANVYKTQLGQIAENIVLNLVEVISIADFGGTLTGNETIIRAINLPTSLNEKAYIVRIIAVNEGGQNMRYYLQAELATRRDIYARALIPIGSDSNVTIVTEGFIDKFGELKLGDALYIRHGEGGVVRSYGSLYGGSYNFQDSSFVVWSWKFRFDPPIIYAGIGIWTRGGT